MLPPPILFTNHHKSLTGPDAGTEFISWMNLQDHSGLVYALSEVLLEMASERTSENMFLVFKLNYLHAVHQIMRAGQ